MLHNLIKGTEQLLNIKNAAAHCDIPCKIYDPVSAQIAAVSVIRFQDLIKEIDDKESLSSLDYAQLVRLTGEKEVHAAKVKEEICIIWGDYFKQPQLEQFPKINELVHSIMLAGSACKQQFNRENGEKLLALVNEFAEAFWATKGVSTFSATSPYPSSELLVYPRLE